MTVYSASIGAKTYVGFAKEATAGTPVAVTGSDYLPLDPDKSTLDFVQGREILAIAVATIFAEQYSVEGEATSGGVLAFPVFPSLTSKFLYLCMLQDMVSATTSGSSTTLTGAQAIGSTDLAVTSSSGFATDDFVQIAQTPGHGVQSEVRKVLSVSGGHVVLTEGLAYAYVATDTVKHVSSSVTAFDHQGVFTKPKSLTVEIGRAGGPSGAKVLQFAGLLPKSIKLSCSSKSPILSAEVTVDGTVKPIDLGSPTTPALAATDTSPYMWKHMQVATMVSTETAAIDDWEYEIMFDNQEFRGGNATALPSDLIVGVPSVTGKFTKLFKSDAEYAAYVAEGSAPAPLIFTFTQGGTGVDQLHFALAKAVYTASGWKQPLKGAIVEEFTFHQVDPSGSASLGVLNTNATRLPYSTT